MRGALLMQLVYSGTPDFSPSVGLGSGVTFDDIDGGYFSLERIRLVHSGFNQRLKYRRQRAFSANH